MNPEGFNIWFPALVGGLVVGLLVAALWDVLRRKTWCFASRIWPGVLKEVGLEDSCLSRAEVEVKQREVTDMLSALSTQITRALGPVKTSMAEAAQNSGSSNCGVPCKIDIESQTGNNPAYTGTTPITFTATAYFPDDSPRVVIRPTKKFFKRYAKGTVKRWRSSIILQASMPVEPCVLAELADLARSCMLEDNRCIFQLGNCAILYYNVGEVHLHILKEGDVPVNVEARWQPGRTDITMRGLYLNGAQVKVATKHDSTILRSDGPAIQGAGDLDELHLPVKEGDFPGEDPFIYASKVVKADGVSLLVRSEASLILPPRGTFALIEALCSRLQRISIFAKEMIDFFLQTEDRRTETAPNLSELRFDHEHLELCTVEHWNGVSEIELLDHRKEVLHYLQELQASGIVEREAGPPSLDSHLIFTRDEHYFKYWQEGLQVLNEFIHQNSSDSHSHTHISIRGRIKFLLGDFESALQDYAQVAHLNTGGHQSNFLLERALVKCMLGRYSEAMQDVVAVLTLSPNMNDIQELETCLQQILDQQRAFRIVAQDSGLSCQRSLLPDQDNTVALEIPDLLTGDKNWHSGEIGSLRPILSDAGTAKSVGDARAHWSVGPVSEALKLQLKLTNFAENLPDSKTRYHVRRISYIVTILEDEWDPDDAVKPMSKEDQDVLNWQAPVEDLQDDIQVRTYLTSMSGRLCPYKNISVAIYDSVKDDGLHVQRRLPHPLSCYRHVSFRSAMLTKHSAADGEVSMFLYGEFLGDRNYLPWRSHDYTKELFISGPRSPCRVFWLLQWDVVDLWHVKSDGQADPDRGLCSNPAAVERQDGFNTFHGVRLSEKRHSPYIAELVAAEGTSLNSISNGNGLNRHRGSDARTNLKMPIPANNKPQTRSPRSSCKPGASQYYGVRFRPDLRKWVAEIRVAEWKAIDKKVWLGTFDTEDAAARAVDSARKILNCKKKRPPNLPCEKLDAYSRQIPPQLILTDLSDASMFKQVTLFIKRECQEYAASFHAPDTLPSDPIIPALDQHDSSGGQFFNPTSSVNPAAQGYENMPPLNSSDVPSEDVHSELDFPDMIVEPYPR